MICDDAIVSASHAELLAAVRPQRRTTRSPRPDRRRQRYPSGRWFRLTLRHIPLARSDAAGIAMPIAAPNNPRPSRVILPRDPKVVLHTTKPEPAFRLTVVVPVGPQSGVTQLYSQGHRVPDKPASRLGLALVPGLAGRPQGRLELVGQLRLRRVQHQARRVNRPFGLPQVEVSRNKREKDKPMKTPRVGPHRGCREPQGLGTKGDHLLCPVVTPGHPCLQRRRCRGHVLKLGPPPAAARARGASSRTSSTSPWRHALTASCTSTTARPLPVPTLSVSANTRLRTWCASSSCPYHVERAAQVEHRTVPDCLRVDEVPFRPFEGLRRPGRPPVVFDNLRVDPVTTLP